MSIEKILAERGKTHGNFTDHAKATMDLKRAMAANLRRPITDVQCEAINMILHKLGRIAAGNPDIKDHWDDIAGYAKLVADRCPTK